MTVPWMLSSVVIATLIGAAALCAERVLTLRRGAPLRWVWMTAIVLSLGWSAWWLLPAPAVIMTPLAPATDVIMAGPIPLPVAEPVLSVVPEIADPSWTLPQWPALSESAEFLVRVVWGGCSAALLLALLWSSVRLRRDRRNWRRASIAGTDVRVSNGFGPAIVGLWRPSIVVPPWVLEADTATQRTILLHEDEHRRAGDQWLLLASFVAVVLAPWNVALWLMGRRLARTIELDCDERVLAHGVADVDYANVLLNAWQRTRHVVPWVPSPALAEHVSRLGRRVEHLMRPAPRRRAMKTIGGVSVSVLLLGGAVLVPRPQQAQTRAVTVTAPTATVTAPAASVATTPPATTSGAAAVSARPTMARTAAKQSAAAPAAPATVDTIPAITVTAQTASAAKLQRARIAVIMPFDSVGMPIAELVHRYLVSDAEQYAFQVISPKELKSYLSASGFATGASLAPADVRALGTLVRADLVVSAVLGRGPGGLTMDASIGSPRDASLRTLRKGEGRALSLAELLVEGLRSDSAYLRLRRPMSAVPVVDYRPAVVAPGSAGPTYPADLREQSVSGDVVARFVVDTNNRVDESTIAILASDRPQFAVAVIESLRTTRFLAAQRDGTKVRQQMQVAFQFERVGTQTMVRFVTDDALMRTIRERFEARASKN